MSYLGLTKKSRKIKKKKTGPILWVIIVIILAVFFNKVKIPGVSKLVGSITNGINNVGVTIKGISTEGFKYFGSVKKLKNENDKLEKEIGDLKYKLLEINTLGTDNENLRAKLGIKERYNHFTLVYADIIIRNYDNYIDTFIINKGTEDGVKTKQAVITEDGLLGYIAETEANTSKVVTILDPNVSVGVEIASVNKNALIKGDFKLKAEGKLKLTYIPIDTEVSVSETIYTSGIGGIYPKGIPVGIIEKVINKKNEIDRYGIIEPLVDIGNIKSVGIIIN
ncbi:MAG: rod shape-determining protein MreC [Clostridia bacterium]|nr:rod shape-determining protein MreC [Clostridia bacterium]MDD4375452.1 rod shape-determining protein MreC [Clostridia bacterium]